MSITENLVRTLGRANEIKIKAGAVDKETAAQMELAADIVTSVAIANYEGGLELQAELTDEQNRLVGEWLVKNGY